MYTQIVVCVKYGILLSACVIIIYKETNIVTSNSFPWRVYCYFKLNLNYSIVQQSIYSLALRLRPLSQFPKHTNFQLLTISFNMQKKCPALLGPLVELCARLEKKTEQIS
jgi:hypothetical protein